MKRQLLAMFGGLALCACLACASVEAQSDGRLAPVNGDDGALPSGAVYEGGVVSHPIASDQENLHLLAGYYYNNPREWKRIYHDNRSLIRNPNRLPVGKTLKIQVGEGWKPRFTYTEWLEIANRNGQWQPGQPWRRARSGAPVSAPTQNAAEPTPVPQATEPPAVEPTPEVTPAPEMTPAAEAAPAETPAPEQPAAETPPAETPALEQPAAEAAPAETPPAEDSQNQEVAPILE